MSLNWLKFPQTKLAVSVFSISFLFYLHLKYLGHSWWVTEFALIVLVIPVVAYAFGLYYYTCAVITVRHDKKTSYKIVTEGKEYRLGPDQAYIKIYFSRKGNHSIYLYDNTDKMVDSPQKANTYEHHITYVEFKKKSNKSELTDTTKKGGQQATPSTTSNSSEQNNEKT